MMAANRNPRKIYVSNLSQDVRERDLGQLMEEVGRIERMQFKNRFAFIEFEKSQCCDDAVRFVFQSMNRFIPSDHVTVLLLNRHIQYHILSPFIGLLSTIYLDSAHSPLLIILALFDCL